MKQSNGRIDFKPEQHDVRDKYITKKKTENIPREEHVMKILRSDGIDVTRRRRLVGV